MTRIASQRDQANARQQQYQCDENAGELAKHGGLDSATAGSSLLSPLLHPIVHHKEM
jgi:hypothetical protein